MSQCLGWRRIPQGDKADEAQVPFIVVKMELLAGVAHYTGVRVVAC